MNTWRNAGTPWYRQSWEGVLGHTHVTAYTKRGVERRIKRLVKEKLREIERRLR